MLLLVVVVVVGAAVVKAATVPAAPGAEVGQVGRGQQQQREVVV
jgi:hypothetical protein